MRTWVVRWPDRTLVVVAESEEYARDLVWVDTRSEPDRARLEEIVVPTVLTFLEE